MGKWIKMSEEKPPLDKTYPLWVYNALRLEWTSNAFVDRYGIPYDIDYWYKKDMS